MPCPALIKGRAPSQAPSADRDSSRACGAPVRGGASTASCLRDGWPLADPGRAGRRDHWSRRKECGKKSPGRRERPQPARAGWRFLRRRCRNRHVHSLLAAVPPDDHVLAADARTDFRLSRTVGTGTRQDEAGFVTTMRDSLSVRLRNLGLSDGKPSPERRGLPRVEVVGGHEHCVPAPGIDPHRTGRFTTSHA
jgi:hypothetical protein